MKQDKALRDHLLYLLQGGGAHLNFDAAIADLPVALRGAKPAGVPHTPWRLPEHVRIAQWDILEFSRSHAASLTPRRSAPRKSAPPRPVYLGHGVSPHPAGILQ